MIQTIRLATPEDLPQMMEIFEKARQIMRRSGNLNQWKNGYPSAELIKTEIAQTHAYVMLNEEQRMVGVFCFIKGPDPTYSYIENGAWPDDEPYYVIHRLASDDTEKGIGKICFDWCYQQWPKLRVDTHADNLIMQKLLQKCGFSPCGIIYLADGDPRLAYIK